MCSARPFAALQLRKLKVCSCCCSIRGEPSRRHAVLLAAGLLASACGSPAHASMEGWDGSSAALGSCPLGDEGDECRKRLIMCGLPPPKSYHQ